MASPLHAPLLAWRYGQYRLDRRLNGASDLYASAERTWQVAPATTVLAPPAVVLPGQLDRVRRYIHWTTPEIERRRTLGDRFDRPPVTAYRLRDVALLRTSLIGRRGRKPLTDDVETVRLKDLAGASRLREASLASSYLGLTYFGHWLKDDGPLNLLAARFAPPIVAREPERNRDAFAETHVGGYVRRLGLAWRPHAAAVIDRLTCFDDEDMTPEKGERMAALRDRVQSTLGAPPAADRVFIKRGISDPQDRRFLNEDAMADALSRRGFAVVDPSACTVDELERMIGGARLIVGAEGSQQVHGLYYLRDGGGVLAITSPDRYSTVNKRWCDLMGLRYGVVVGHPAEGGFEADADEVLRTVDAMGAMGAG